MSILLSTLDRVWSKALISFLVAMMLQGLVVTTYILASRGAQGAMVGHAERTNPAQGTIEDKARVSSVVGKGFSITEGERPELDKAFEELNEMQQNNDPRASEKQAEIFKIAEKLGLLKDTPQSSR